LLMDFIFTIFCV
ncbi:putative membrane protein, partial [Escherichia coli TW00353]